MYIIKLVLGNKKSEGSLAPGTRKVKIDRNSVIRVPQKSEKIDRS